MARDPLAVFHRMRPRLFLTVLRPCPILKDVGEDGANNAT